MLGPNLGETERNVLQEVRWMALDELSERDRCFLWASGLLEVLEFWNELISWGDDISFPSKRTELLTNCDFYAAEVEQMIDFQKSAVNAVRNLMVRGGK